MKENRKIVRYKLKQNLEETVALNAQEKKNINEQNFHLKNRKEQSQLDKGHYKNCIPNIINVGKLNAFPLYQK